MATPNLKLLLNAMRLGQPQDPQAAVFALAEALMAQEEVIDELKRRLHVVQSAAHILETKASRLESELEALRYGGHASPPPSERPPPSFGPPPMREAREAMPSNRPPARPASEAPPPLAAMAMPPMGMPRAPRELAPLDAEDSQDDFRVETVVVNKRDVEILMGPEAPFRIAPAGQHNTPRGSIPGAPWARGGRAQPQAHAQAQAQAAQAQAQAAQAQAQAAQAQAQAAQAQAQAAQVQIRGGQGAPPHAMHPPVHDEFTIDAHHDGRDEGDEDGETFADTNRRPPNRPQRG
jgi:hypothetical protein